MRLGNLIIAFLAVLALVVGSTALTGLPYWAFTLVIIAAAGAATWVLYVRRTRRWITESYRCLTDARLDGLLARVEAELARQSSIQREVLEQLKAEVLYWSGDFERALALGRQIDTARLPELWRGATWGLIVAASALCGRTAEARATLQQHEAALRERQGFDYLDAMVSLREGDAPRARECLTKVEAGWPRSKLVRAALAMLQAELALAHGEDAGALIEEACRLGGDTFVPARARALTTPRSA